MNFEFQTRVEQIIFNLFCIVSLWLLVGNHNIDILDTLNAASRLL